MKMKGNKWAKETPVKLVLHSPPLIPHRDGFGNSIAYFTPLSPPCSREQSQGSGALQWRCPWCWIQLHMLHSHGAAAGWETLFFSDREQILFHRSKDYAIWKSLSRFCRLAGHTYALGVWCIRVWILTFAVNFVRWNSFLRLTKCSYCAVGIGKSQCGFANDHELQFQSQHIQVNCFTLCLQAH